MPDTKPANDVADYAAAVRAALAPLPDAERDNLLEDLESHLAEVAGESDQPLRERLGKPEDYAAELRSAYGAGGDAFNKRQRRPLRDRAWALIKGALGTQVYRELRSLLPELRPGWWILRAYLAVLFLAFVFRDGANLRPIPNPFSSGGLLQIVATFIAIVISVRLGRRGMPLNRGWRGAVLAANVAIALLALPVLVSMGTGSSYVYSYDGPSDPYFSSVSAGYYPGFSNIYPYSRDGKPLTDVLLYDQDGHPLVPGKSDVVIDVPNGADGLPIPNAYPLNERDLNGVPITAPRVALPPWPNSGSTPSPTPSPSP
jgi:uncharacterized membrane protein